MHANRWKMSGANTAKHAILVLFSLVYLYPLVWLLLNSLKSTKGIFADPWGWPETFVWRNYVEAWVTGSIGRYFINSVFVTASSLTLLILISAMAAFVIARMKWRLSGFTLGFFLLGMMIPIHATLLPLFIFFSKMSLTNSLWSLILLYTGFGLPAAILILSNFFRSLPREIEEAAAIDGCGMARIFWTMTLPMSKSAIFTVLIFSFVSIWNELLVALVFISDANKMTLPVGLMNFKGQYATNYAPLLAATILVVVPSIALYSLFNNRIIEGMTVGAVKG